MKLADIINDDNALARAITTVFTIGSAIAAIVMIWVLL